MHELIRQRDLLTAELADLEAAFGPAPSASNGRVQRRGRGRRRRLNGSATGRPRRRGQRARNSTSLVETLGGVLNGTTMTVSDIIGAVHKAGYKTTSRNFRSIVNQALLANKKAFRRVARGQYTAR